MLPKITVAGEGDPEVDTVARRNLARFAHCLLRLAGAPQRLAELDAGHLRDV